MPDTRNNFTALRLIAVLAVIYGNSLVLTSAPPSAIWGVPFAAMGLNALFAISGYLVTGSWERAPNLPRFLLRRLARLLPGLAACVLATVFVVGPLATRLRLREYFLSNITHAYLGNMVLRPRLWLPGVFEGQQWVGVVNGVLWTLLPGVLCCLSVPVLARLPWRARAGVLAAGVLACGGAGFYLGELHAGPPLVLWSFNVSGLKDMLAVTPFFLAGALLRLVEDRAPGLWRADYALLCFAANWLVASWLGAWTVPLAWLTVPYMAVCLGRGTALRHVGRLGNPAYGLFLYAFPIQQLVVARWPDAPYPILACLALALPAAYLSWHLVERPALWLASRWAPAPDAPPLPAAPDWRTASEGRLNNFDALRAAAALMVIHGHGWNLTGGPGPGLWGVPFARVGLDVFFSISGYLITTSWLRTPDLQAFLAKRVLRILPGLAVCVLATAFVLGPFLTSRTPADYLASATTWSYLANIALNLRLFLPGVFEGLGENGAVNGSLWSLLPEFLCYLSVPLLALVALQARPWALAAAALLCGGVGLWLFEGYKGPDPEIYNMNLKYALVAAPFFMVGGLLRLVELRVPDLYRADAALLCFAANYVVSSWFGWWNVPLEWFTLPYMVICFGRLATPVLRRAGRFGDLSYGLYLYAFPIQQAVVLLGPGPYPILTCVALTAVAAFLSWHLVEQPALRWKPAPIPSAAPSGAV